MRARFVGLNLFQSAFTNWCPTMTLLGWVSLSGQAPSGQASTGGVSL
jgi:hypothetical protein